MIKCTYIPTIAQRERETVPFCCGERGLWAGEAHGAAWERAPAVAAAEGAFRVDMGDTQGIKFAPNFNITPNGITYLEENTMIKKVERFMGNQLIKTASGLLGLKL